MNNTTTPRPTPEERASTVKLAWYYSPLGKREIDRPDIVAQIAVAIRTAVDEETAALYADLVKAHDTIRQLAERVAAQSEALSRKAEAEK